MAQSYLRQLWHAAWWADELQEGEMHPRTIAEEPILFWRETYGELRAIQDRCPHRSAPLSMGKRIRGGVRCGYHGIAFDGP